MFIFILFTLHLNLCFPVVYGFGGMPGMGGGGGGGVSIDILTILYRRTFNQKSLSTNMF